MRDHEHLHQATRNEAFYHSIDQTQFPDWAVTVLFYAAVHFIDAWLARFRGSPQDHEQRWEAVQRTPFLKSRIYHNYRHLYDLSINTRYQGFEPPPSEITRCAGHLASIRSALNV